MRRRTEKKGFVRVRDPNVVTARQKKAGPHKVVKYDETCSNCGDETCRDYGCVDENES